MGTLFAMESSDVKNAEKRDGIECDSNSDVIQNVPGDVVTHSEYKCLLSDEVVKKAEKELNETEKLRAQCLSDIRNWLKTRPALKNARQDDVFLLWFLRSSKFKTAAAQRKFENFFSFRLKVPEWYNNRDPLLPEISRLLEIGCYIPLKGYDDHGRRVVITRCCVHKPKESNQDDIFKVGNMVIELMNRDDEQTSVCGVVSIFDLKGATLSHALAMTPGIIKKAVTSWQDVVPVRLKGLHFINIPFNAHVVLNVFKQFMKEKLKDRVHLHGGNLSALHSLVPLRMLPEEYGGTAGPVQELIGSLAEKPEMPQADVTNKKADEIAEKFEWKTFVNNIIRRIRRERRE